MTLEHSSRPSQLRYSLEMNNIITYYIIYIHIYIIYNFCKTYKVVLRLNKCMYSYFFIKGIIMVVTKCRVTIEFIIIYPVIIEPAISTKLGNASQIQ